MVSIPNEVVTTYRFRSWNSFHMTPFCRRRIPLYYFNRKYITFSNRTLLPAALSLTFILTFKPGATLTLSLCRSCVGNCLNLSSPSVPPTGAAAGQCFSDNSINTFGFLCLTSPLCCVWGVFNAEGKTALYNPLLCCCSNSMHLCCDLKRRKRKKSFLKYISKIVFVYRAG